MNDEGALVVDGFYCLTSLTVLRNRNSNWAGFMMGATEFQLPVETTLDWDIEISYLEFSGRIIRNLGWSISQYSLKLLTNFVFS